MLCSNIKQTQTNAKWGSKHFHCSSPFKAVRAVGAFLRFGQFSVTAMKNKEKGGK